jgi:hypothetical protein
MFILIVLVALSLCIATYSTYRAERSIIKRPLMSLLLDQIKPGKTA